MTVPRGAPPYLEGRALDRRDRATATTEGLPPTSTGGRRFSQWIRARVGYGGRACPRATSTPADYVTTQIVASTRRLVGNKLVALLIYPILLVAAAIVLTGFRLSGTSVGMYVTVGAYAPPSQSDPALLAGTPRMLRWDEWVVNTPYIVSQSKLGYPRYSPSAVGGQDLAVIGAVPNRHWSTVFKPYDWPFFTLDLERAFAAHWWLIGLLLLLPSYALFFVLTGRIALAAAFSVSLYASPFFQWWYLPVSLASAGFAMGALACLVEANRRNGIARWVLLSLSAYSLISFALLIYPPFQISTGIVICFVGAGWLVGELASFNTGRDRLRPVLLTAIVGVVTAAVLVAFYVDVSPTIAAITNTAYPGYRQVAAGTASLAQVFGGPFDFWLTTSDSRVNQPEASSFLLTGIFVVPQVLFLARFRTDARITRLVLPGIGAMILLLAWALLPLPSFVGTATLLNRVPTSRAILGIGLASSLVTFLALAAHRPPKSAHSPLDWAFNVLLLFLAGALAAVGGLRLRTTTPLLGLRLSEIAVGCVVFTVLVALVLARRAVASSLGLIIIGVVMSLTVNPLYRGLVPLESSPLLNAANLGYQGSRPGDEGAVLSYLGSVLDPLVVSSGRPVLNAANLYPNLGGWHALDPTGVYTDAWNRYSGTDFVYSPRTPAQIRNTAIDAVVVSINPCDPSLSRLHVTTVISSTELKDPCLTELGKTRVTSDVIAFTYGRHGG